MSDERCFIDIFDMAMLANIGVYIVDIAMLVNIESTPSILYVVNIVDIVDQAMLADIEFKSFLNQTASILFKWLTSQS